MHGVAGGATELRRLHVFDCAIGDLGADNNIYQRGDTEKPSQALKSRPTVELRLSQFPADTLLAQVDPNRDERQASKKNDRENEKNYDPDVRISDMTADLERQDKQPRDSRGRDQKDPGQTHPMLSQHKPSRSVLASVHGLGLYALPLKPMLIQRFRVVG
jgi:hypothetical protein